MERLAIALIALTVIVSGCLDSMDSQDIQDEMETEPDVPSEDEEPDTSEQEQTESEEQTSEEETTQESESEVREVVVEGGSYFYEPENIDVEQGETVRFIFENTGGLHDLVLEDSDGNDVAGTEQINGGESDSFTYTFEDTEDFEFYCSIGSHRAQGMEGTVTVN